MVFLFSLILILMIFIGEIQIQKKCVLDYSYKLQSSTLKAPTEGL